MGRKVEAMYFFLLIWLLEELVLLLNQTISISSQASENVHV